MNTNLNSLPSTCTSDQSSTPDPINDMKLRLKFFKSKKTPRNRSPKSKLQFKKILCQTHPHWPSPSLVRHSLNQKNELQSDGGNIAPANLIFKSSALKPPATLMSSSTINPNPEKEYSTRLPMEVEDKDKGTNCVNNDEFLADDIAEKSFSVAEFLRKVLVKELGNDSGLDHKLIVVAVHAVLLDSGFVGFDPNLNEVINRLQFPDVWPSNVCATLFYTLPEIAKGYQANSIHTVLLKFQSFDKFIDIYGSLAISGELGNTDTYSIRLNEDQFVPYLNKWANCGVTDSIITKYELFSCESPEKEVLKFWNTIKDFLVLPLLIDICEIAGFLLPPCFMRLPDYLMLKILELVTGIDVAKVSCVCKELRYVASSDDLWKLKFVEEFGDERKGVEESWRKAFARISSHE